jgi:arylsulfatase A-like enzyme
MPKPNVIFLLADQLRATSLPLFGEKQISTPNLDRLAATGITCTQAVSTVPICTPYRAMLLTGRQPHSTGMVGNFIGLRHDEIGIGDAFSAAGYQTAWIGKWHLQVGAWPGAGVREGVEGASHIPPGRQRLGFEHWRGYNFHEKYFEGWVDLDNWRNEIWDGYETEALNRYALEFIDRAGDEPFCLFLSPHQPHHTTIDRHAPEKFYRMLPEKLTLPDNVPESCREECLRHYRDYLAMILALDEMLGELMQHLEETGQAENTILVFTSDHGSQFGAQGLEAWDKAVPYEESVHVPLIIRLPEKRGAGTQSDALITPVDLFPTLCGLCGIQPPRSVDGRDLSGGLLGETNESERKAVLMANYADHFCFFEIEANPPGKNIWRAVRTKEATLIKRYGGEMELYDLKSDPLQLQNLAGNPAFAALESDLLRQMEHLLSQQKDSFPSGREYQAWFDSQRRVIRNAYGPLPHPESMPDFSLVARS